MQNNENYLYKLTKKELEALESIVLYGSLKMAAREMNISPRTLEIHINHIKEKLNLAYKHQLNKIVIEHFYVRKMNMQSH
jgi:DNA-binding NarL/FixJ family response regulator